jgi:hypothetical protein
MALVDNSFAKCAPAISTNIRQCGSVTLCDAKPITQDQLTSTYMTSGDYKVLGSLFQTDFEIKMCEAVQNGLYDFLRATSVNLSKKIQSQKVNSGLVQIAPFVLARQYSPINNEYWKFTGGQSAAGGRWEVTVESTNSIPFDTRSFQPDEFVFVTGLTDGGTSVRTAYQIYSSTDNGDGTGTLVLTPRNTGSFLDSDRLVNVEEGLIRRGTNNKSDYESFCNEAPAYTNWKNVPFWVQTSRTSMCRSETYDKWRKLLLEGNELYKEFGDVDEIQRNKQLGADWQKRWVNSIFWNKPISANQTLAAYDQLDDITSASVEGLDVGGAECVGKRANAVGIYEQLAECGRVQDLQGATLSLDSLFKALYNIKRVREGVSSPGAMSIDLFMDSTMADLFNTSMLNYFKAKAGNVAVTFEVNPSEAKSAPFGFSYRSYKLFWPQGVTINVITHNFFDDAVTAASAAGVGDAERYLWVLDFSGIYPGILATNRQVLKTGDLKTLAQIDSSYACVLKTLSKEQTLTSTTYTVVVECPSGSGVLENFAQVAPTVGDDGAAYWDTSSSTATTP